MAQDFYPFSKQSNTPKANIYLYIHTYLEMGKKRYSTWERKFCPFTEKNSYSLTAAERVSSARMLFRISNPSLILKDEMF